jgi:hypothetical protein
VSNDAELGGEFRRAKGEAKNARNVNLFIAKGAKSTSGSFVRSWKKAKLRWNALLSGRHAKVHISVNIVIYVRARWTDFIASYIYDSDNKDDLFVNARSLKRQQGWRSRTSSLRPHRSNPRNYRKIRDASSSLHPSKRRRLGVTTSSLP